MFESKKRVMEALADMHSWEPVDTVSMIFETLEKTREDMKQAAEESLANQRREWADIVRLRQEQRKKQSVKSSSGGALETMTEIKEVGKFGAVSFRALTQAEIQEVQSLKGVERSIFILRHGITGISLDRREALAMLAAYPEECIQFQEVVVALTNRNSAEEQLVFDALEECAGDIEHAALLRMAHKRGLTFEQAKKQIPRKELLGFMALEAMERAGCFPADRVELYLMDISRALNAIAATLGVNPAEIPLEKCRLVSSTRPVRLKNRRIKRADEYTPEERRKRAEAILSGLATVSSLTEYIED